MFSAFEGDYGCRIGSETRNGARIQSAVVEEIENQGCYRDLDSQFRVPLLSKLSRKFSIISATAGPFRALFRDSVPIQHQ
jgi:hypothetical protein